MYRVWYLKRYAGGEGLIVLQLRCDLRALTVSPVVNNSGSFDQRKFNTGGAFTLLFSTQLGAEQRSEITKWIDQVEQ